MRFVIKLSAYSKKMFSIQVIMLISINRGKSKDIFYITGIIDFYSITVNKTIMNVFKVGNRITCRRISIFSLHCRIILSHNTRALNSQAFCNFLRSLSRFIQNIGKILTVKIHHFFINIFPNRMILPTFLEIQIVNLYFRAIIQETIRFSFKIQLLFL